MNTAQALLATTAFAVASLANTAFAGNAETVQKFYDLLSNPGSQSHVEAFKEIASDDWESIGDYSGENKSKTKFIGQISPKKVNFTVADQSDVKDSDIF